MLLVLDEVLEALEDEDSVVELSEEEELELKLELKLDLEVELGPGQLVTRVTV